MPARDFARELREKTPRLPLSPSVPRVPGAYWRPNPVFVKELTNFLKGKSVLEVFAGNGYLSAVLQREGITIRPTTLWSGHDGHSLGVYTNIEEFSAPEAVRKLGAEHDILLMSWPTVTDAALVALLEWGPDRDVVFIGEMTDYALNHLGGCATDEFFDAIEIRHRFEHYEGNRMEAAVVCRLRAPAPGRSYK